MKWLPIKIFPKKLNCTKMLQKCQSKRYTSCGTFLGEAKPTQLARQRGTEKYELKQCVYQEFSTYSWGINGFNTPQSVCSKTTLITSSASVAGVNPSPRKMDTFFSQVLGCYCVNLQTFPIKWSQLAKYQTSQEFFSYNRALYKCFCSTFYTSPVGSI